MEHDDRVPLPESSGLSKTIESVTDAKPMLEFTCEICQITAPYEHYSHESPKGASKKIKFHEKCYNLLDPFRPPRQRLVLVVGAACSGKIFWNISFMESSQFCLIWQHSSKTVRNHTSF